MPARSSVDMFGDGQNYVDDSRVCGDQADVKLMEEEISPPHHVPFQVHTIVVNVIGFSKRCVSYTSGNHTSEGDLKLWVIIFLFWPGVCK
jgi:hypothetical protein